MFKFSLYIGKKLSFEEQIRICRDMGFYNLEICDVMDGETILDITDNVFRKLVMDGKLYVPSIKIEKNIKMINADYLKAIIIKCSVLGIECINVGDFTGGWDDSRHVVDILQFCNTHNVRLCIENEYQSFFNDNDNLTRFFKSYRQSGVNMVYNPLEFVKSKHHPFLNLFYTGSFKNHISFLRINDGVFCDGSPRFPGEGNAEIKEIISALRSRRFAGYLSLLPYFEDHDVFQINTVYENLKKIISSM